MTKLLKLKLGERSRLKDVDLGVFGRQKWNQGA